MANRPWSSLIAQSGIEDHAEVLKTANAALKRSGADLEAQHVRIVALLKLDRFDDAYHAFQSSGKKLKDRASLEYAYLLYKTWRFAEAELEAGAKPHCRGMRHVSAQAMYRSEKFEGSAAAYRELIGIPTGVYNEYSDLHVNTAAVAAQMLWSGDGHSVTCSSPVEGGFEAFETAYNAACGAIARKDWAQAVVLLKKSSELCNMSDELSETEKRTETTSIMTQLIYVLIRKGQREKAKQECARIRIACISDPATKKIARVNAFAVSAVHSNPHVAYRLLHSSLETSKADELFSVQSTLFHRNCVALDILAMKAPGRTRSFAEPQTAQHSIESVKTAAAISVLHVAAHARNRIGKGALAATLALLRSHPYDTGTLLAALQMLTHGNKYACALALLESFLARTTQTDASVKNEDLRYPPGLIALMVSLYVRQMQNARARFHLKEAARFWLRKSKSLPRASLLRAAGTALLASSDPCDEPVAAELFDALYEQNALDHTAKIGQLATKALSAHKAITQLQLDSLSPVSRYISEIDAGALEGAGVVRSPAPLSTSISAKRKKRLKPGTDSDDTDSKRMRVRASRLPKDRDPKRTPDPERWLPLRDRSSYRPRGKKGKTKMAGLTQGGPSTGSEERLNPTKDGRDMQPALVGAGGGLKRKKKGKSGKW